MKHASNSTVNTIQTLEQIAQELIERRMVAPAIFILELCKPLVGCAREIYDASEGWQRVLFGERLMPAVRHLFSSSDRVEELIILLEQSRVVVSKSEVEKR